MSEEECDNRLPRYFRPEERPAHGDIVAVDWGGQVDLAEITLAGDQHAAIESVDGRTVGGRLERDNEGLKLHTPSGPVWIWKAGTFLPGYAKAVEHFEERRAMELEEREKNRDLDDWLKEVNNHLPPRI